MAARGLLQHARWALALVTAAALAVSNTGCEDPVAALTGVTTISTQVQGHTHRCSIPLSDIEDPPSGGRSYTSTTAEGHSHTVLVSQAQLADLQQPGAAVSVQTSENGATPHRHVFNFVR
jgi:hypothetical protein